MKLSTKHQLTATENNQKFIDLMEDQNEKSCVGDDGVTQELSMRLHRYSCDDEYEGIGEHGEVIDSMMMRRRRSRGRRRGSERVNDLHQNNDTQIVIRKQSHLLSLFKLYAILLISTSLFECLNSQSVVLVESPLNNISTSSMTLSSPPSQLFLSSRQQPTISLVSGFKARNQAGEEGEDQGGFIMQASNHNTATVQLEDLSTSGMPTSMNEDLTYATTTTVSPTSTAEETTPLSVDNERIPIDMNRQQFDTHDQLINATTKDESIYLSPNADNQEPPSTMVGAIDEPVQKNQRGIDGRQSSRAGMSKVSHVTSFLSGKLEVMPSI